MTTTASQKAGILIPTYNRTDLLRLSLDSALNQSHGNTAIIVIDNGSEDATSDYMAAVADPRVSHIVNERDLGLIGSINKGIRLMPEEVAWCTILADDDLLDPRYIERSLKAAACSRARNIIHSHRVFVDAERKKIRDAVSAPSEESAFDYLQSRAKGLRETYLTGVLFHRNAFEEIGGYPEFTTGMASDDAFIFALSLTDRLVYERSAVATVTLHSNAESQKIMGVERHFRALDEFAAYVRRAAGEIGGYDPGRLARIETIVDFYITSLNSTLWLRSARALAGRREELCRKELESLCEAVRTGRHPFRPRVKLDALCLRATGFDPESIRLYRSAWKRIEKLYFRI